MLLPTPSIYCVSRNAPVRWALHFSAHKVPLVVYLQHTVSQKWSILGHMFIRTFVEFAIKVRRFIFDISYIYLVSNPLILIKNLYLIFFLKLPNNFKVKKCCTGTSRPKFNHNLVCFISVIHVQNTHVNAYTESLDRVACWWNGQKISFF